MEEEKRKFCSNCGNEMSWEANVCHQCGAIGGMRSQPTPQIQQTQYRNENISAVLSFLIPGLGQVYNGELGKGIFIFLVASLSVVLMALLIGFIMYPIVWVWGIYDAHQSAKRLNEGR